MKNDQNYIERVYKTMKEIPAKLLLIINAIDKGSAERNGLLRNYLKLI